MTDTQSKPKIKTNKAKVPRCPWCGEPCPMCETGMEWAQKVETRQE